MLQGTIAEQQIMIYICIYIYIYDNIKHQKISNKKAKNRNKNGYSKCNHFSCESECKYNQEMLLFAMVMYHN